MDPTPVGISPCQVGIQRNRFRRITKSLCSVPLLEEYPAAIVLHVRVRRADSDRLVIVVNGLVKVILFEVGVSSLKVGERILRIQLNGFGEIFYGSFIISNFESGVASVVICQCIFRIQL